MTTRLLIVDDDPSTRTVLTHLLTSEGFSVEAFSTAEDALVRLRATEAELLLTDLVLPGMSGLELVAEAKRILPDLRCFVMSGLARAPEAPLDLPWVLKPIDVDLLLAVLAS